MPDIRFDPKIVGLLLPDALLKLFGLDRPCATEPSSEGVFRYQLDESHPGLRLEVWPEPNGRDPCYVVEVRFNFLGIPELTWLAANDLRAPRFEVDALGRLPLEPSSGLRNITEEIRAMEAGLAPNQVRAGLHLLRHSFKAVDLYCAAVGVNMATIFAMAYHNAVEYQRCGFSLRSGEELMAEIEEGFSPGGRLTRLLDDSTPFRKPEMAETLLGRSWAIHDGIMGSEWYAPELLRIVATGG